MLQKTYFRPKVDFDVLHEGGSYGKVLLWKKLTLPGYYHYHYERNSRCVGDYYYYKKNYYCPGDLEVISIEMKDQPTPSSSAANNESGNFSEIQFSRESRVQRDERFGRIDSGKGFRVPESKHRYNLASGR